MFEMDLQEALSKIRNALIDGEDGLNEMNDMYHPYHSNLRRLSRIEKALELVDNIKIKKRSAGGMDFDYIVEFNCGE